MDEYEYAGANLGGQMLFQCPRCGGLVQESHQGQHTVHHDLAEKRLHTLEEAVKVLVASNGEASGSSDAGQSQPES